MASNVTFLPSPLLFTGLTNVTACIPHDFIFAYNTSDPFILKAGVVNNLTAWVEPVYYRGITPPKYLLADEMALSDTVTDIPWNGTGIPPNNSYAFRGKIKTSAPGTIYAPIYIRFAIASSTNTSCGVSSSTPEFPHSTGFPAENATGSKKSGGGAIAGIVVGVLISLLICAAGLFLIRIRRRMRNVVQEPPAYQRGEAFAAEQKVHSGGIGHEVGLPQWRKSLEKDMKNFETDSVRSFPPSYKEDNL